MLLCNACCQRLVWVVDAGEDFCCRIAELEERFFTAVTVAEIVKSLSYEHSLISFVYEYWKLKRKANFGNPLLAPKGRLCALADY